jgi:membrane-bound metal-dependent hydrolase YbcI (DUF457 family)
VAFRSAAAIGLRLLYLCCLAGYLPHPLLDACTSYGTHLWLPFSQHVAKPGT